MKILIIGSGGREHALAWKLAKSPRVTKIFVAPGNAGTAALGENVAAAATDITGLLKFASATKIDLTVVGQDDPLALGVVDAFQAVGLKIWGPTKAAAQIESSKAFAKKLMVENGIPTARFETFRDYERALAYLSKFFLPSFPGEEKMPEGQMRSKLTNQPSTSPLTPPLARGGEVIPIVIKASGLALGKGVTICRTLEEAAYTLKKVMVEKIFGDAGTEVVIEKFLEGREFSIHAFADGTTFQLLPPSQDHKPVFNGNLGPNTGGMGTIAPLPWLNEQDMDEVARTIVEPALRGLKKEGVPFSGLLYPGLMMTTSGPKVIEFNARFGDPETQSYMRLLKTDLLEIIDACLENRLNEIAIAWEQKFACCIAAASGGYPGKYEKGKEISGVETAEKLPDIVVFHAGIAIRDHKLVTNGGRVLGVTATGNSLKEALDKAYEAIKLIHFEGMHYRHDIGAQSL